MSAGGLQFVYEDDFAAGRIPCQRESKSGWKSRPVRCVETGEVYGTSIAAGEDKGCSASHITSICRGGGRRKRAGGYHWEYADRGEGE
jgi:hypothetical protein